MSAWPGYVPQELVELEALNIELRDENRLLHERLGAQQKTIERMALQVADRIARVGYLDRRRRWLHDYIKRNRPGPKPRPEHEAAFAVVLYTLLGGHERGKGQAAIAEVAEALRLSERKVREMLGRFQYGERPVPLSTELIRLIEEYGKKTGPG
jgi:hypothetical protein